MKSINALASLMVLVLLSSSCSKDNVNGYGNNNEDQVTTGSVTDIEGNTYKTVKIGEQWWMAENLKTTKLKDGTDIDHITGYTDWENATVAAFCWYENNVTNKSYGAYYNFSTVLTEKLCPEGWRVPTYKDVFTDLYPFCDYDASKLKSTTGWDESYREDEGKKGTDKFGFNALPYGKREKEGGFLSTGGNAYFWQIREEAGKKDCWNLHFGDDKVSIYGLYGNEGINIRCIKE